MTDTTRPPRTPHWREVLRQIDVASDHRDAELCAVVTAWPDEPAHPVPEAEAAAPDASEPSPAPGIHPWTLASDEAAEPPWGPAPKSVIMDGLVYTDIVTETGPARAGPAVDGFEDGDR